MSELQERLQGAIGDLYRIDRELGGGGMSRVFLATEASLNRRVVIKVLSPELTSDVMSARFRREMEITALLQHPHILPVLTTGTQAGLLYYVTPFVEGESLRHRLEREGRLPVADVVRILSELASALAYAHERGVVHRDIKPENVLLSNGLAVLADFGISAVFEGGDGSDRRGAARLTDVGVSMGTPGYMSPEQAAGERELDGRSDLYSLAVVGYEMLTGNPPFTGPTPLSIITAHLTATPKPVQTLRPDVPAALAAALDRALAKKPGQRFATTGEFREALGVSYSGGPRASGRTWIPWAAAAALVVVAGAAALLLRGGGDVRLQENLIAIAPFETVGGDLEMWREGLVDLLAANLDGAGPLRTVPPSVVVRRSGAGRLDREGALALGDATGAGYTVFGTVMSSGRDSIRVQLDVLDTRRRAPIGSQIVYRGEADRLDRLSDSLTYGILRELNDARGLGATRGSSLGSSSVAAIKEFLVGEQFYRRSDWDSAAVHYRNALSADSNFAPALRHLSNAIGWKLSPDLQLQQEGYELALLAGTKNTGLAPRESLLVSADSLMAALFIGRLPLPQRARLTLRLTTMLEDATRTFSVDPEIWFKLGDVRVHFTSPLLPARSNRTLVRQAFERSITLDSAFAPSYIHLMGVLAEDQDEEALRAAIRAFLSLDPQDVQGEAAHFVMRVLDGGNSAMADSTWEQMSPQVRVNVLATLFTLLDSAETQIALARRNAKLAAAARSNNPNAQVQLAAALTLRGHYQEALAIPDSNTLWVFPEAALAGALASDSASRLFAQWREHPNVQRGAMAAGFWAQAGDTASVRSVLTRLEALERGRGGAGIPYGLANGLLAIARSDTAGAIRHLSVPDSVCFGWCPQARFYLTRLLSAQRRDSAAAEILDQDFPQPSGARVLWMLEKARVNERLGRTETAIDSYVFVRKAWERGDASVQWAVQEARQGLERLRSDAPAARP